MCQRLFPCLVILVCFAFSSPVRADVILVSHSGSNNPLSENMLFYDGANSIVTYTSTPTPSQLNLYGTVGPVNVNGTSAWQVADTSSAGSEGYAYHVDPTAVANGWTLSATLSVSNGSVNSPAVGLIYVSPTTEYELVFGLSAGGDLQAAEVTPSGFQLVYTAPDANFHTFSINYNPTSGTATVETDGSVVDSANMGHPLAGTELNNYAGFGSISTANTGTGNFSSFSMEATSGSAVPEPGSLTLAAIWVLSLGAYGRLRRAGWLYT